MLRDEKKKKAIPTESVGWVTSEKTVCFLFFSCSDGNIEVDVQRVSSGTGDYVSVYGWTTGTAPS